MHEVNLNNIILVGGYTIIEQLKEKQYSDENLDGAMHLLLSQESSKIFNADQYFRTKLQEL